MNNDTFLENLIDGQARVITIIEALKAGQDDMREDMKKIATKEDLKSSEKRTAVKLTKIIKKEVTKIVKEEVDGAKSKLKTDLHMMNSSLIKKVNNHEKRITNLEEHAGTPDTTKS